MSKPSTWVVICASCGKPMPINSLLTHWNNRHNWKLKPNGEVDDTSNPYWNNKGVPP